jgi:acyl-coenzyme A thioesterase PaaI-like protein
MSEEEQRDRMSGLAKQPNSRHCFVCGLENPVGLHLAFYRVSDDEVLTRVALPEGYQGYPGIAHGGIVASILDEVVGRAAMGAEETRFMVTAKLQVRYRLPVPVGQPLRVIGKVVSRRGKVAEGRGELRLADGTLAAEADAVLVDVPDMPGGSSDWESLGWRVVPDEPAPGAADG